MGHVSDAGFLPLHFVSTQVCQVGTFLIALLSVKCKDKNL